MMNSSRDHVQRAYNAASAAYAEMFLNELDQKPLDRELLQKFTTKVEGNGRVLDIGCGPGHTTAVLHGHGLNVCGVDLSPEMIDRAEREFPGVDFEAGDFFSLNVGNSSIVGLVAFYSIVHLSPAELPDAFAEFARVLAPGSPLLLAFHVGTEVVHTEDFLESGFSLDFTYFDPDRVVACLAECGFVEIERTQREAYESEYPSQRCYVTARKRM